MGPMRFAKGASDSFEIEILDDGRIKILTGDFSSPAIHTTAEAFLGEIARLAGGTVERKSRGKHEHHHTHGEGHEHTNA